MGRTSLTRTTAAFLAGTALFLTSAGACGGGGEGDDDGNGVPGVTQQDGDDDGGAGDDDGGAGDDD
jgi:hypothetical protein